MRIIMLLTAAAGAAAIGTAAPARPAGKFNGPGAGSPWASAPAGAHRPRTGWQAHSRRGMDRGHDRRHDRHGGRFGRPGRHGPPSYGGFGIVWPSGPIDPYGNGFFAGGGGEVRMKGGRPYYDYDRSYPYEWASASAGHPDWEEEERGSEPRSRCTFENGVRVCRGW